MPGRLGFAQLKIKSSFAWFTLAEVYVWPWNNRLTSVLLIHSGKPWQNPNWAILVFLLWPHGDCRGQSWMSERLHQHNKCHLLNNSSTLFFDRLYWFSWETLLHKGTPAFQKEDNVSKLWMNAERCNFITSYLSPYFILLCSACQSRGGSALNATASQPWHTQLPCTNTAF